MLETAPSPSLLPQSPDICFQEFKNQLALLDAQRGLASAASLIRAYHNSCPTAPVAACDYGMLVFRYLCEAQWRPGLIVALFASESVSLPGIYTDEGLEMLQMVETMCTNLPSRHPSVSSFYRKMAALARSAPASDCTRQDRSIRLLIRGLWGAEIAKGVRRGKWIALHHLSMKLSSTPYRDFVIQIFNGSQRNAIERLVDAIEDGLQLKSGDCIENAAKALDFIPRSLLRTWASPLFSLLLGKRDAMSHVPWHVYITKEASKLRLKTLRQKMKTFTALFWLIDCQTDQTTSEPSASHIAFQHLASLWIEPSGARIPQNLVLYALLRSLRSHHSMDETLSTRLNDFITPYMHDHAARIEKQPLNDSLLELIVQLNDSLLPNHGVIELMLPLVYKKHGLKSALDLLQRIAAHQDARLSNTTYLVQFNADAIQQVKQQVKANPLSTERNRQSYVLALDACRELREVSVSLGAQALPRDVYALLDQRAYTFLLERAEDAGIIPLSYRDAATIHAPIASRVALIGQLAMQYSRDRSRSHRQNWRSVYTLYKYLQRNQQTPTPLFARAVVNVCVMQPLAENDFVSMRRLRWVLKLVEAAECIQAARRVEAVFWHRRGEVIAGAKRKLTDSGALGFAHVRTMKRLGLT